MAGISPQQLVDLKLVEIGAIGDSLKQDYDRVHDRLDKLLEKAPRPLADDEAEKAATTLCAWLSGQAERNVPLERLTSLYRCGLGHIAVELCRGADVSSELVATRAFDELRARGWIDAVFDPQIAAEAAKRLAPSVKKAPLSKRSAAPTPIAQKTKSAGAAAVQTRRKKEDRSMSSIDDATLAVVPPGSEAESAPSAKKPASGKKVSQSKAGATKKSAAEKKTAAGSAAKKTAAPNARTPKAGTATASAAKVAAEKKAPQAKATESKASAVKKSAAEKKPAVGPAAKKPAATKKTTVGATAVAKKAVSKK